MTQDTRNQGAVPPRPVDAERVETVTLPAADYRTLVAALEADDTFVKCEICGAWLTSEENSHGADINACWARAVEGGDKASCRSYRAPRAHSPDKAVAREGVAQGTLADEPYDPLVCAVWATLLPFRDELLRTGGVTFMGLRNAIVETVRSFAINSQAAALAPKPTGTEAGRGVIPAGWKLVPEEPTEEMLAAAWKADAYSHAKTMAIFNAMLAATPTPPVSPSPDEDAPTCYICDQTIGEEPAHIHPIEGHIHERCCTGEEEVSPSPDSTGPAGAGVEVARSAFDKWFAATGLETSHRGLTASAWHEAWAAAQTAMTPSAPIADPVKEGWYIAELGKDREVVEVVAKGPENGLVIYRSGDEEEFSLSACNFIARLNLQDIAPIADPVRDDGARERARKRIQSLGAALSRRDWSDTERAYEAIRDAHDRPEVYDAPTPASDVPGEAQTWKLTGTGRGTASSPGIQGKCEMEWFRPSDGTRQYHPVGFNPNTGRYEGLVFNNASSTPGDAQTQEGGR